MDSLQQIFSDVTINVFSKLFNVKCIPYTNSHEISEDKILYSKITSVKYDEIGSTLHMIFSSDSLLTFKKSSEETIQKLYPSMNTTLFFSNIIGIIVYNMYNKIRYMYSTLDYDFPRNMPARNITKQTTRLSLYDRDTLIGIVGFTFNEKKY